MTYETKLVPFGTLGESLEVTLNLYGKDGWRTVAVIDRPAVQYAILERSVEPKAPRKPRAKKVAK